MSVLDPIKLGDLSLPSRLVFSATWSNTSDGGVTDALLRHYSRIRAGLVIVEHTAVSQDGLADRTMLRIDDDKYVEGHRRLVETIHRTGAKAVLQINHAGRMGVCGNNGPSAVSIPNIPECTELDAAGIERVEALFFKAAERARTSGYDGVQIHSAHGYLLSEFLSPVTNRRTDAYGGSIENRARLLVNICKRVATLGLPVAVKVNCSDFADGGLTPLDVAQVCRMLEGVVTFVELSGGAAFGKYTAIRKGIFHTGPDVELWYRDELAYISKNTAVPLAVVGGIRSLEGCAKAMATGATLVSMSRPFIRHPNMLDILREHRHVSPCVSCNRCVRWVARCAGEVRCHVKYPKGEEDPYGDMREGKY